MSQFSKISIALSVVVLGTGALLWENSTRGAIGSTDPALVSLKESFRRPERIPFPTNNPFSEEKYQLGKRLFFDPRLSSSGTMACATCHNPSFSWSDGQRRAVGHGHKILGRRSPTILNAAWGSSFFWDGRADTLEQQALGPIQAEGEMNQPLPGLIQRLESIAEYRPWFEKAFPGEPISSPNLARAIATFERTIVSGVAPFDRWIAGEEQAISTEAKRGFLVFNGKGTCVQCHNGWNFTNGSFTDTGLPDGDLGRGKVANQKILLHTFKTPTLRKVSRRAPYMHDGSLPSLRSVIENYDKGGAVKRAAVKLFLKPLHLTDGEKKDLLAFLETLDSDDEVIAMPSLPRGEWGETSW